MFIYPPIGGVNREKFEVSYMKYTDFVKDFSFQKYKSAKFSPAALDVFRIQVNIREAAAGGKI